jgi:hypothetical protein
LDRVFPSIRLACFADDFETPRHRVLQRLRSSKRRVSRLAIEIPRSAGLSPRDETEDAKAAKAAPRRNAKDLYANWGERVWSGRELHAAAFDSIEPRA